MRSVDQNASALHTGGLRYAFRRWWERPTMVPDWHVSSTFAACRKSQIWDNRNVKDI
jgi:hypothetical protein